MLEEALTTVAAAGGTAVVQAAGTDAWGALRLRVARLFGRADGGREHAELEQLDRTAELLATAGPREAELVRESQETSWRHRFEVLLESLDAREREEVAAELRRLSAGMPGRGPAEGSTVSGNTFRGPTAFQIGDGNQQDNHFGSGA
ncbi:hypothetical protein ACIPYS_07655 [Kitasatospora sp. NPDC089913]|uniref:hypothetical protein n=1 Tax=Streptomycetaceae TaxID=2062 RepID=UPI00087D10C7|nr:hypothetical protein [Streptomyces sp. TLI_053]SDT82688.1 hypothetical protein SAMN05216371_7478 [Streptomyces sp. TLI_053]